MIVVRADSSDDIGDAGGIVLADEVIAVDPDLHVQAVVDQQDGGRRRGVALVAGQLGRARASPCVLPFFSFTASLPSSMA